jgi:hypothetical protein
LFLSYLIFKKTCIPRTGARGKWHIFVQAMLKFVIEFAPGARGKWQQFYKLVQQNIYHTIPQQNLFWISTSQQIDLKISS